jgi:hypothetical protein
MFARSLFASFLLIGGPALGAPIEKISLPERSAPSVAAGTAGSVAAPGAPLSLANLPAPSFTLRPEFSRPLENAGAIVSAPAAAGVSAALAAPLLSLQPSPSRSPVIVGAAAPEFAREPGYPNLGAESAPAGARLESQRARRLAGAIAESFDVRSSPETADIVQVGPWSGPARVLPARRGGAGPRTVSAFASPRAFRRRGGVVVGALLSVGGIAALGYMTWKSLAAVTFAALPSVMPGFGDIWGGTAGLASAWDWAWISVALSSAAFVVSKLLGYRSRGWAPDFRLKHLIVFLPTMAYAEELFFRVVLMLGGAKLIAAHTALSAEGSMMIAALVSSVIFAAAHGYGPKLPRILSGLLYSYLLLTGGFLLAGLAHYLHNAILIVWERGVETFAGE